MRSKLELVAKQLLSDKGYHVIEEYRFFMPRKWRADFAVWRNEPTFHHVMDTPTHRDSCLVEVEGIPFKRLSRHQHRDGFAADCEKYNAAAALGWTVFRFTGNMVADGSMERLLEQYFDIGRRPYG